MSFRRKIRPLELVISAIYHMRKSKGSSIKEILKFLEGKYKVNTEELKPHVYVGLKKGLSFGLLSQESGLYKLSKVLRSLKKSMASANKQLTKKPGKLCAKPRLKRKAKSVKSKICKNKINPTSKPPAKTRAKKRRALSGKETPHKNKRHKAKSPRKHAKPEKTPHNMQVVDNNKDKCECSNLVSKECEILDK